MLGEILLPPPPVAGGRRFLALHLPTLATDRIRRAAPELPADRPLGVWATLGPRRVLVAVDRAAAMAGLRAGQALADAQAIAPELALFPEDAPADAQALEGLALWARRYTPLAATDPPDGLLLDITGCTHFWGDEAGLLDDALARLRKGGLTAQGGVAGIAPLAGAMARAGHGGPVESLPLADALRLDAGEVAALERLGLRRVGDLLALPRGPLARRFGGALLERLDALLGHRRVVLRPVLPPPELVVMREMLEPIVTRAGIEAVLDVLLEALCAKLRAEGLGARQVVLSAWRVDAAVQEVAIGTGQPVRGVAHLRLLFRDRLEALSPGLGIERFALEARATDPVASGLQTALAIGGRRDAGAALELLDRLRQRVRVRRVAMRSSHWPERMVQGVSSPAVSVGWRLQPAVRLLRRPEAIGVVASVPDGPPALVRWGGAAHRVLRAQGPRRVAAEWWRGEEGSRDYFEVELESGLRLWIFRADDWHLHGHLP
ncbi:Y-family DNA polymerase [Plastoroseomonas arctica]|uniref:DNA polymerase Y family protein n=1 Tax=Plastoroseomonas arctica TaxID=1509237 RepID=A0AAF1JW60_9PROT|nr:DNA polymerase Y family protein [Plastoroseomonas arctica]MBR0654847.1 DNA polymerase Y family protein [Plastoroseomonas arctica]